MIDSAFTPLLPYLQQPQVPTLWLADENASSVITLFDTETFSDDAIKYLHIATNRYDIYQAALQHHISVEFNDFTLEALPFTPENIVYRVSKEKSLSHYLLNTAAALLPENGQLIISGKKQEGIKSYGTNILRVFSAKGQLKKLKSDYIGHYAQLHKREKLDDQQYPLVHTLPLSDDTNYTQAFASKPGIFGWNKIDKGSELLLKTLPQIIEEYRCTPKNILDLGCGYGWIFMNLPCTLEKILDNDSYQITATDNNAAAIHCAKINAEKSTINTQVIADDCAKNIGEKFDLIVCNPPFHKGFTHDKSLTTLFIEQTYQHLTPKGIAVFVVNEFISLPSESTKKFSHCTTIVKQHGFKIIVLQQ